MDRIAKIEIYQKDIPLKQTFVIALEEIRTASNLFVKITTKQGLVGWGESSPFPSITGETGHSGLAIASALARPLLGQPLVHLNHNIRQLHAVVAGNPGTKSAFDMALYDLIAQQAGMPLYAYLGGSADRTIITDMTIGLDTPQEMARQARAFKNEGFTTIKIKLGQNYGDDLERIQAIRAAISARTRLRIDANQGWDFPTALRLLKAMEKYDIEWCEAPLPRNDLNGLALLNERSPIPIMADESVFSAQDALQHIRNNACHFFNIKLAKTGGIHEAIMIIHLAETAGISLQVGCFSESRLGITALWHLVQAQQAIHFFDMDSPLMHSQDPIKAGITFDKGGKIVFQEKNIMGLGASVDEAWLDDAEQVCIKI